MRAPFTRSFTTSGLDTSVRTSVRVGTLAFGTPNLASSSPMRVLSLVVAILMIDFPASPAIVPAPGTRLETAKPVIKLFVSFAP